MRVWLTADTHFGHKGRMPGLRNFESIEEHDDVLAQRWNKLVKRGDTVLHLGDVGLGRESYILKVCARLNGQKHLIAGNHDAVWPGHREAHKHLRAWMDVFESVQFFARRRVGPVSYLLSHLPYHGDHTENVRYQEYRLPNTGMLLLHGHVHDKWLVQGNQINVGVDQWRLQPVSLDEVIELAKSLGLM